MPREKADWRRFGDGNMEWEKCRGYWKGYEDACERHIQDIELFIQWDRYEEKTPEEKLGGEARGGLGEGHGS